jgi:MtN3 and saliva related transmembrane protein
VLVTSFIEETFGMIASVTTVIGIIPQVYKSYKLKSMEEVSMVMLVNYAICSVSWLVYGLYTKSSFIIGSNAICTITSALSIWQKASYKK